MFEDWDFESLRDGAALVLGMIVAWLAFCIALGLTVGVAWQIARWVVG